MSLSSENVYLLIFLLDLTLNVLILMEDNNEINDSGGCSQRGRDMMCWQKHLIRQADDSD